ncbi:MAG: tetratricopeptide repeat protein [Planctomycetes bacterium]|nr:tetratricopeptide repeat protein [Planctomycetota bacterium]
MSGDEHQEARRAEQSAVGSADSLTAGVAARAALWRHVVLLLAAVAAVVVATHWRVLSAQALSFDDVQYLTENELVRNPSWNSVGRFFGEVLRPSTVGGYYQPLAMTSLMLDCARGGTPDNLRAFHETNLALHTLNTALVGLLLYALFGRPWVAAAVGLLFGVHPLTVESVAWLSDRKTLLATCFTLWCLLAYVRYVRRHGALCYGAALMLYTCALLSKPTSIMLPFLLLLLDYWPLRRRFTRYVILEKLPLLVLCAAFAIITFVSQVQVANVRMPGDEGVLRIPLTVCHNIVFYLYKIFWPVAVSAYYPFPRPLDLSHAAVLAGVIGTGVLLAGLLISLRWTRAAAAGWLFFFVAILPTLGVVGITGAIAADRYAYLPLLGILLCVAHFVGRVWDGRAAGRGGGLRRGVLLGVVVLLALLEAYGTRAHLAHWRDSVSLYRHMVAVAPDAAQSRNNLAIALVKQGQTAEAIEQYTAALRLEPDLPKIYGNLGAALAELGRVEEAGKCYAEAVRRDPQNARNHYNLGLTWLKTGRLPEAVRALEQAVRLQPDDPVLHNDLGNALAGMQQFERGIAAYREALRLRPEYAEAHHNLGLALVKAGRVAEALPCYAEALRLDPENAGVHNSRGTALARLNRIDEAVVAFRTALRCDPNHARAHNNLGQALALQDRPDEAVEQYTQAIRLQPDYLAAYLNLGEVLAQTGRRDEAAQVYQRVLQLVPGHAEAQQQLEALRQQDTSEQDQ